MSAGYWETFRASAREQIESVKPSRMQLAEVSASARTIKCTLTWNGEHELTIACTAPVEQDALRELVTMVGKL